MFRQDRQTSYPRKRVARVAVNLTAAAALVFLIAACAGGPGGLAAYQGDSSYGCLPSATKTVCPK